MDGNNIHQMLSLSNLHSNYPRLGDEGQISPNLAPKGTLVTVCAEQPSAVCAAGYSGEKQQRDPRRPQLRRPVVQRKPHSGRVKRRSSAFRGQPEKKPPWARMEQCLAQGELCEAG